MGDTIHRQRTTQEALDALQLLINGEQRLHIPVQPGDADVVLGDVITERDSLRDALKEIGGIWLETGAPPRLGRAIARLTGQVYEL